MLGALNSFVCNKYWTFREKKRATAGELLRFALVNGASLFLNGSIVWSVASILHTFIANPLLWANIAKGTAIIGTSLVSYVGMRFWVFTQGARQGK
jgi:putative flippase GtrA